MRKITDAICQARETTPLALAQEFELDVADVMRTIDLLERNRLVHVRGSGVTASIQPIHRDVATQLQVTVNVTGIDLDRPLHARR